MGCLRVCILCPLLRDGDFVVDGRAGLEVVHFCGDFADEIFVVPYGDAGLGYVDAVDDGAIALGFGTRTFYVVVMLMFGCSETYPLISGLGSAQRFPWLLNGAGFLLRV